MKTSLSALDINHIVKELQFLIDAKIDRIYQPEKGEFLLQFHKTGHGKAMIRVLISGLIFLTGFKKENPEMNHTFCISARKLLLNSRLRELKQIGFERVVEFVIETKEKKYKLIFELFSKGNAIITDENNKILLCLERQMWKERAIKPKENYIYPEKEFNFLEIDESKLKKAVKETKKQNIVKMLALDLGLGGVYAEELCLNAGIDKEKKTIEDKEVKKLFNAVEKLRNNKTKPLVIMEKGKIIDIVPFDLNHYKDFDKEKAETFNKALDNVLTEMEISEIKEKKTGKKTKELERIKKVIEIQEKQIQKLEKSAEENQRKGELIYENYKLMVDMLVKIKEARKTMSWKEIKDALKNKKLIKNIDEKTGEITIEV